jgi:hypothetical protein
MANSHSLASDRAVELLEKLLAVKLYSMGTAQGRIAQVLGKSKTWVNDLLKGIPKNRPARNDLG